MRQFRRLTVPTRAHPLVRRLYEEMNRQQLGLLDLAERSGVNKNTIKDWKDRSVPQVQNLAACFNVLGLELTVKKEKSQ